MKTTVCAIGSTRVSVDSALGEVAAVQLTVQNSLKPFKSTAWLDAHGAQVLADSIYALLGKKMLTVPVIDSGIDWQKINDVVRGNA